MNKDSKTPTFLASLSNKESRKEGIHFMGKMAWLRMLKEHILTSFHVEKDDLDYAPFDANGGIGKMYQLFGGDMDTIITEMNEALAV